MNVTIECSIGEIIDKITILDIKCEELKDENRLNDCKKEKESLLNNISHLYNKTLEYYRKILRKINKQIWDDQEVLRVEEDDIKYGKISKKVIIDNDARFRVKKIINTHFNSGLREQKSYVNKGCLVASHLGLGDSINMISAVRYLSTLYDKIIVPVKDKYVENMKLIYSDNPFIEIVSIPNNPIEGTLINQMIYEYKQQNYDIYSSGSYKGASSYVGTEFVPKGFYMDMGLNYSEIYQSREWFFCNDLIDRSILEEVKKYNIIVVHKDSSTIKVNSILNKIKDKLLDTNTLVIDLCENQYTKENEVKYNLAQYFVYKPLSYYSTIIEECNEIYLTDSSIYCMTVQLNLKANIKECYIRECIGERIKIYEKTDSRFTYYIV